MAGNDLNGPMTKDEMIVSLAATVRELRRMLAQRTQEAIDLYNALAECQRKDDHERRDHEPGEADH